MAVIECVFDDFAPGRSSWDTVGIEPGVEADCAEEVSKAIGGFSGVGSRVREMKTRRGSGCGVALVAMDN